MTYETVIGLEVHVELATKSKIFCSCRTDFGAPPNSQCCPVCLGLPGALPVLNRKVAELALRLCLATDCKITLDTRFDRKNYFYPDLPKAYQISQLHLPIGRNGHLQLTGNTQRLIRIHEIHMEEDAGKLLHDPWTDQTLVDYNRCGVPLLEIVSEPDLRSAEEAIIYLQTLRQLLMFLGLSDCKMEQGSLRADVNVSVRPTGSQVFGTRTEMKNMNSFKAIERAIRHESLRQIEVLSEGGRIIQETRRWDENKDMSFAMRSKEDARDYRYFPDPDLIAVSIDQAWIDRIRDTMPERPEVKASKYKSLYQLSDYEISQLLSDPALAALFEETVHCDARPSEVSSWLLGEWLQVCRSKEIEAAKLEVTPAQLAVLLNLMSAGTINRTTARQVFDAIINHQVDPVQYVREKGLAMMSDTDALDKLIAEVITESSQSVKDYLSGKEKARQYLIGQVMRKSRGKADPAQVQRLLTAALDKLK